MICCTGVFDFDAHSACIIPGNMCRQSVRVSLDELSTFCVQKNIKKNLQGGSGYVSLKRTIFVRKEGEIQ